LEILIFIQTIAYLKLIKLGGFTMRT
jgi:hypothetical protein